MAELGTAVELHQQLLHELVVAASEYCSRPRPDRENLAQALAQGMLVRARAVLTAVDAVSSLGLASEAATLGRVLCEGAIKMNWVSQSPQQRAERIVDEATLHGAKVVRLRVSHGEAEPAENLAEISRREVTALQRQGLTRFQREMPVSEMAAQAGMQDFYDFHYRALCMDAHPSVQSLVWAGEALASPDDTDPMVRTLFHASRSALELIDACCNILGFEGARELRTRIESAFLDQRYFPRKTHRRNEE